MPCARIQAKQTSNLAVGAKRSQGDDIGKTQPARPSKTRVVEGDHEASLGGRLDMEGCKADCCSPGRTTIAEHLVKRVCLELCRQLCRVKAPTQCGFAATPPLPAVILASHGASVGKYPKLRTSPSRHFWSQLFIHTSQYNPRDCPRTLITCLRPARSRAANFECIAATLLSSARHQGRSTTTRMGR